MPEMSELRRRILMRPAACSLVIHAMSPCSCTGSPRCNSASLALRTGRRGWELVWVADLGEFAADAMTWRRMPGRGVRRQRHGLPGGAAVGDCHGPAGTGGGARSLSWSGASCVVSCPGWSAADASVAVGCLGGWYWLGPGPGSVRYAVRCCGLIAAGYAGSRARPVPGRRAQVAAQRIEQGRGHQCHRGDRDRSREAEELGCQLEQGCGDSADQDRGGRAGHGPLNHVARLCADVGQAGEPCRLRVVPDDDGSHFASLVTSCAQPARRP